MCFGTADATEFPLDMFDLDNWRDAVVLMDVEVVDGRVATRVFPEAPEDDVRKLEASPGGASDTESPGRTVLDDILLASGPSCGSQFWLYLSTSAAPWAGSAGEYTVGPPVKEGLPASPPSASLEMGETPSCLVVETASPDNVFFGLGALKSWTRVPLIRGS